MKRAHKRVVKRRRPRSWRELPNCALALRWLVRARRAVRPPESPLTGALPRTRESLLGVHAPVGPRALCNRSFRVTSHY